MKRGRIWIWGVGVMMALMAARDLNQMTPQQRRLEGLYVYVLNMLFVYKAFHDGALPSSCEEFLNSPVMFRHKFYLDEPSTGKELQCVSANPVAGEYSFARDEDGKFVLHFSGIEFGKEQTPIDKFPPPVPPTEVVKEYRFAEAIARHLDAAVNEFEVVKGCYPRSLTEMENVLGSLFKPNAVDISTGENIRSLLFSAMKEVKQTYEVRRPINEKLMEIANLPADQREIDLQKYSYPGRKKLFIDIPNGTVYYFFSRPQFDYVEQMGKTIVTDSRVVNMAIAQVLRKVNVPFCKNLAQENWLP